MVSRCRVNGDRARARQFYDLAVRWSGSHKEALTPYLVELTAFHAEATALLEVTDSQTSDR